MKSNDPFIDSVTLSLYTICSTKLLLFVLVQIENAFSFPFRSDLNFRPGHLQFYIWQENSNFIKCLANEGILRENKEFWRSRQAWYIFEGTPNILEGDFKSSLLKKHITRRFLVCFYQFPIRPCCVFIYTSIIPWQKLMHIYQNLKFIVFEKL